KKNHDDVLEIDEFWTYVGKKSNKIGLMYAYHRASGEIVAYVWGKRALKTAQKLKEKRERLGITYDRIATDNWQSFVSTFTETEHVIGKKYTVGIEGRPTRHRNRRVFRKTCCFSKKRIIHRKVFDMTFFYINEGHI
ncbi:MAG: IS1 family transposase, partial [Treponema sp.]|nr:IS1 family transposase [Treponema sp.]